MWQVKAAGFFTGRLNCIEYLIEPVRVPRIIMNVLTERIIKDPSESMLFAYDIVLGGGNHVDTTRYIETPRNALEERERELTIGQHQTIKHNSWMSGSKGNKSGRAARGNVVDCCATEGYW